MDHVKEAQFVTIHVDEYARLLRNDKFLANLKAHGVDNWDGYSDAYQETFDDEDY